MKPAAARAGFSLLELLAALVVATLAVTVVARALFTAQRNDRLAATLDDSAAALHELAARHYARIPADREASGAAATAIRPNARREGGRIRWDIAPTDRSAPVTTVSFPLLDD